MKLRRAWLATIAATLLMLAVAAGTLWMFPPGQATGRHYDTAQELINDHLATVDDRLYEREFETRTAIACPTEWRDTIRTGSRSYTLEAHVTFAHHDDARGDWVPTCDEDATYYAIEISGQWPGAPAPVTTSVTGHRFIFLPAPEAAEEPDPADIQFEDGPYLGMMPLADPSPESKDDASPAEDAVEDPQPEP